MRDIITITRQFGSLGRPIAKEVATRLNMKYYDRDIIDIAARNMGMNVDELLEFEGKKLTAYDKMLYPLGYGDAAMKDRVYKMEKSVILELATNNKCVFVGRGVDYLLNDVSRVLNVYVFAPYEERLKNCIDSLHMTEAEAKKYIRGVDKARLEFYKTYCGSDYTETRCRHLLIDSAALGEELTIETICNVAKSKLDI